MVVRILVDHRERAVLTRLRDTDLGGAEECKNIVAIEASNLEYGDVWILVEQQNNDDTTWRLVFERKTMSDLAASIKDGRYREQKLRLLAHCERSALAYIIEGGHSFASDRVTVHGLSHKAVSGALINTMYRDGIRIVHTQTAEETAHFLTGLATRIAKDPDSFCMQRNSRSSSTCSEYAQASIQARRTKRMGTEHVFATQLSIIPGVSPTLGSAIAARYDTMANFLHVLASMESHSHRLRSLQALPQVGKKTANSILTSLGLVDTAVRKELKDEATQQYIDPTQES